MSNDDPFWAADEDARPPLVWIADDSPLEAQIVRRSLGNRYDVELFADGSSLLERLAHAQRQPDILLLDWVMPGISGEEVCRFLRAQPDTADVSILLVTASRIEVDDVVAGLAAGADDYVAKPFAPQELRARLEAVLRGKRLREAALTQTRRLEFIAQVARRLAAAGPTAQSILDTLCVTLTETLGDGCLIATGTAAAEPRYVSVCHCDPPQRARLRELLTRESDFGQLSQRVLQGQALAPLHGHLRAGGDVVLWRGADGLPFTSGDRALLDTCLEYGSLAFQNALLYEAERRAALERQQNARFQEQFMGMLGHDLRNPISAIALSAAAMTRRLGPTEARALGRITASAERMRRMVDQLLDLARARLGGGIGIVPRAVDLGALTRGVIEELQAAHPECTLVAQIDTDVKGEWDPDRLEQVVSNIATNAVQHGRQGCPVTIAVRRAGEEGVVEIHNQNDEGAEIPADLLPVLFDPFRRGRAEQQRSQGLGLGLFITREIVLAHGGRIEVESTRGAGTRFRISLPLRRPLIT